VFPVFLRNRFEAEKVCFHRQQIVTGYARIGRKGERGKVMLAFGVEPLPESLDKFFLRPLTDTRVRIRGDIGHIKRPERRLDGTTSGEWQCIVTFIRMTRNATAGVNQVFAALHQAIVGLQRGKSADQPSG
jgi:hypothetical protein